MSSPLRKIHLALLDPYHLPYILMHKMGTQAGYHLLKTISFPPETVNIYPTFRCNLKCKMCFEKFTKIAQELKIEDWRRIIIEVKKFKPRIHISGGEPFLYPEIISLIEFIRKNHLFLHITTNGTDLYNFAKELVTLQVNRIDISIDGPGEIHDRLRGVKGSFEKIIKGLEVLKKYKKGRHRPVIKFNSIINLKNPGVMKEIVDVAQIYGVKSIQFIYPLFLSKESIESHGVFLKKNLNQKINYWLRADSYKPEIEDFRIIHKKIIDLLKGSGKIEIKIFPAFDVFQFKSYYTSAEEFNEIYKGRCRAPWSTATILPDGSIESCPDYIIGKAGKESFLKIWNNNLMAKLRKLIRDNRFFSVCRACCFFYQ